MYVDLQQELVELLSQWSPIPVTYAGGASSLVRWPLLHRPESVGSDSVFRQQEDLDFVDRIGHGKVTHTTIPLSLLGLG